MGSTKGILNSAYETATNSRFFCTSHSFSRICPCLLLPPILVNAFFWGISIMSCSNLGLETSLLPTTKDNLSTVNVATCWSGNKLWLQYAGYVKHAAAGGVSKDLPQSGCLIYLPMCHVSIDHVGFCRSITATFSCSSAPRTLHCKKRLLPRQTRFRQALGGQDHSQSSVQG